MTPAGRKKTVSALVVVGNKKGAVGMYVVLYSPPSPVVLLKAAISSFS